MVLGTAIISGPGLAACTASRAAGIAGTDRYRIAVCDWMILKRQKLSAFALASEIKADGIELDMGGLGDRPTFDSKLGDPAVQQEFLNEAKKQGVGISSIAMSGFYAQSFAQRETVPQMVQDTVDTMKGMGIKVAYLPLGVQGDLVQQPELRPGIVKRLRMAGQKAQAIGAVIAVETALDASGERSLLKEIDSEGVKISFNFANAIKNGKDICKELELLGAKNIAQIHCSNTDGKLIQEDPVLDMPKIKKTLDRMNWSGWLIIERSRDTEDVHNVRRNYGSNATYMKSIFQS